MEEKSHPDTITLDADPAASSLSAGLVSGVKSLTPSTPQPSLLLAGRYQLHSLLGTGGMGTVYRAHDHELDEEVALKVLRRDLVASPGMLERFRREVKLARRVTHRNVARTYDIGEHGEDRFLTMEYVEGEPLSSLLARTGRLPTARVLELAQGVCDGLTAAHDAGVVHRDLKPENILLARDGRVVLTDFGIARAMSDTGNRTLGAVGTPAYMSPEQVEGAPNVDERADLYSLGVILYELFVGEVPFKGESIFAIASARLGHEPPDARVVLPSLDEKLALLLKRAMARKPADRFPTARAFSEALATLSTDGLRGRETPVRATPVVHEQPAKTVAVLPFRSAGSPEDEYLADGLTEDLIDLLSVTAGLRVRPRGAIIHLKGQNREARELGHELGVDVVVEGSLRKAGDTVRINTRVSSAHDGFQLWARRLDRKAQDVLSASDEIARAIAQALMVDEAPAAREAPTDPAALDAYFRARFEYHRYERDSLERAVTLFEQARSLAPDDPMILTGYALARARLWFFGSAGAAGQAREAAERAIALAPGRAEPHVALGAVRFQEGNCLEAVREARRAIAILPTQPDAHDLLGKVLMEAGPLELGMEHFERAASLDPAFADTRASVARGHELAGRHDEADALFAQLLRERGGNGVFFSYGRALLWRRDVAGARKLLEDPRLAQPHVVGAAALLHFMVEPEKGTDFMEQLEKRFASPHASWRSWVLLHQLQTELALYAGRHDEALTVLARAVDAGLIDAVWLDGCPLFEPVRADARFVALRARVEARARPLRDALA